MTKIQIVGAGPCGSIAALSAMRNGHDVVISEEHKEAGTPTNCSGLFSKDGLESLKKYISYKKFIVNSLWGADIYFDNELFLVRAKKAMAHVCNREEFDAELASNAEAQGAKIHYNERIKDSFRYNHIIGADGPNSSVAKYFGFPPISKYICTMQAMFDYDVAAHMDAYVIKMYLSKKKFPGFFGWVIPHSKDTAEFGVGVMLPNSVDKAWGHLMKLHNIKVTNKPKSAIIPVEARRRTAFEKNKKKVLLVGDAAGHVKATSGGGVIFGGNCAGIAGKHVETPLLYEFEWRARFGTDLLMHRVIRDHLNTLSDPQLAVLGRKLKRMRFDEYLSKHGNMDKPTSMITPQTLIHSLKVVTGVR